MLALNQGGSQYAYLYDGKGNIEAVLDNTQAVAAAYRYDPFGVLLNQTGSLTQPYGFSTKRYDAQTGLIHYEFRDYLPALARWTARDPLGESGGTNLYAFVGNNPVNWVDPWGLATSPEHHPPGWTEGWRYDWGSRDNSGKRWWDPKGGEWRWHPPDKYHPDGHWDYNPWNSWNSPWRNVPGNPPPHPAPKPPWWKPLLGAIPDPYPVIVINPCMFEPWRPWCPENPFNPCPTL